MNLRFLGEVEAKVARTKQTLSQVTLSQTSQLFHICALTLTRQNQAYLKKTSSPSKHNFWLHNNMFAVMRLKLQLFTNTTIATLSRGKQLLFNLQGFLALIRVLGKSCASFILYTEQIQ